MASGRGCKRKMIKLRRPYSLRREVRRRLPCAPQRGGQSADRRWMRNAAPGGPPCGRADPWIARDHRPMTLAGAPLGAPPRHFSVPGRAFRRGIRASSVSQLLAGGRSTPRRSPGDARVRGDEPRPQVPHPAPSAERHRLTPLSERGEWIVLIFLLRSIKSQGFYSHKFVRC